MKLAVCMPSRGLINSRTISSVLENLKTIDDWSLFFTHDQPIPDCFNTLVSNAFEWGADYIWFVEEDMLIYEDTLSKMIDASKDIVTVDYPVTKTAHAVINGKFTYCSTGCTLVKREVLENTGEFRDNILYELPDFTPIEVKNEGYGRHDVDFCIKAQRAGYDIHVIGKAGQYKLKQLGQSNTNKGTHEFEIWEF